MAYLPFDPSWLDEADVFHHRDGRVVAAGFAMLVAAWRSEPAGSIGASFKALSRASGLSEIEVGEHYEVLTHGWQLRDDRLYHIKLSDLCERLHERFAPALEQIALQAAVVVQAPEDFTLQAPEPEHRRTRGRTKFPAVLPITNEIRQHMLKEGFVTQEDQDWIFTKHRDWARAEGVLRNDWAASLCSFVSKEHKRNIPSRQTASVVSPMARSGLSRQNRFGSAGFAAENHNASMMASVRERGAQGV